MGDTIKQERAWWTRSPGMVRDGKSKRKSPKSSRLPINLRWRPTTGF